MFIKEIELQLFFRLAVYMTEQSSHEITQVVWLFLNWITKQNKRRLQIIQLSRLKQDQVKKEKTV